MVLLENVLRSKGNGHGLSNFSQERDIKRFWNELYIGILHRELSNFKSIFR